VRSDRGSGEDASGSGRAHFLLCLKAYLEHGINLRADSITRRHLEQFAGARR